MQPALLHRRCCACYQRRRCRKTAKQVGPPTKSTRQRPTQKTPINGRSEARVAHLVSNNDSALALDPNTLQLSYLWAPALIWDDLGFPHYRIGETPGDGRLCFASLDSLVLRLCARRAGRDNGWVLEREDSLIEAFDSVPDLPIACTWLSDIDPGRTGKVFIRSFGYGHFFYDMNTGKLDRLITDDGQEYGHPIFAYFSAQHQGDD